MDLNPKVVNLVYTLYGIALGGSFFWGLSKLRYARKIRARINKLAETRTITITDFAGKSVSLERFCDRLFAPELVFEEDENTRRHKLKFQLWEILILFLFTAVVLALIYFT